MPNIPAIKPTNLKPTPELPEFEVRITVDFSDKFRAADEEDATEQAWGRIMDEGDWDLEVTEQEDDDGTD